MQFDKYKQTRARKKRYRKCIPNNVYMMTHLTVLSKDPYGDRDNRTVDHFFKGEDQLCQDGGSQGLWVQTKHTQNKTRDETRRRRY